MSEQADAEIVLFITQLVNGGLGIQTCFIPKSRLLPHCLLHYTNWLSSCPWYFLQD